MVNKFDIHLLEYQRTLNGFYRDHKFLRFDNPVKGMEHKSISKRRKKNARFLN